MVPSARGELDLVIVGAGAAGLIAADFALRLSTRVALVERERIGGDCTWTGCVPSKALIKVAGIAAAVRTAARYGLSAADPVADMGRVRAYLQASIQHIYAPGAPEALRRRGLQVYLGEGRFLDPHTLEVAGERLSARRFLICTGAEPRRPVLPGLDEVPYCTYREIFDNERLPRRLAVIGGGPLGCEIAQAYRRLGAQVTLIGERLLPRAEPEAAALLEQVFMQDGIERVAARASAVVRTGEGIAVRAAEHEVDADLLLVAVGRRPRVQGLALEAAGVRCHGEGIEVNGALRTSARHIYAAGDVVGGAQFSHLAGWQGFHAARNALLPWGRAAVPAALPQVTFTAPEVAQIGLTERAARERFGGGVQAQALDLGSVDRAVTDDDRCGLIKLIAHRNGRLLGATVMSARAGEAITELSLALSWGLRLRDVAAAIHPYPTYGSAVQLLATQMAMQHFFGGRGAALARRLSAWSLRRGARGDSR